MSIKSLKALIILFFLFASLIAAAQDFKEFKKGFYYSTDSVKHEGFISYEYSINGYKPNFKFKSKEKDKAQKIKPEMCIKFTYNTTEFIVLKNFKSKLAWTYTVAQDFVEVIDTGKVNLYKHGLTARTGNPTMGDFYSELVNYELVFSGKKEVIFVMKKANDFAAEMSSYFQDYELLSNKIKNKELGYDDIKKIVRSYNEYWSNK
jgi:hypothetical protein